MSQPPPDPKYCPVCQKELRNARAVAHHLNTKWQCKEAYLNMDFHQRQKIDEVLRA